MVKADLVDRAMEAAELDSSAAQDAVEALFESVASALARGDRVVLRRFGVFRTRPRKTGVARNPRCPTDCWHFSLPTRPGRAVANNSVGRVSPPIHQPEELPRTFAALVFSG